MKGYDILKSLNHIDEKYIVDNEVTKEKRQIKILIPLISVAAVIIIVFMIPQLIGLRINTTDQVTIPSNDMEQEKNYSVIFNEMMNTSRLAGDIAPLGISFNENISKDQAKKLFPILANKYEIQGHMSYYYFEGSDNVNVFQNDIFFSTDMNSKENNVSIIFAKDKIINCIVNPSTEDKHTIVEGVELYAYKGYIQILDVYHYFASLKIDDIAYEIHFESMEQSDAQFVEIVVDVILGGKADWSTFNPQIPE